MIIIWSNTVAVCVPGVADGGAFVKKFAGACGGGELFRKLGLHAYPAGASFCADKRMQKRFRAAP